MLIKPLQFEFLLQQLPGKSSLKANWERVAKRAVFHLWEMWKLNLNIIKFSLLVENKSRWCDYFRLKYGWGINIYDEKTAAGLSTKELLKFWTLASWAGRKLLSWSIFNAYSDKKYGYRDTHIARRRALSHSSSSNYFTSTINWIFNISVCVFVRNGHQTRLVSWLYSTVLLLVFKHFYFFKLLSFIVL